MIGQARGVQERIWEEAMSRLSQFNDVTKKGLEQ